MTALTRMFLAGAIVLLSGCQITHPGFSSLAFVEIKDTSLDAVHEAVLNVFAAERYEVQEESQQEIVFVREGTLNDRLQYARYQEGLHMRVEITLEPYGPDGVLVRADAYAVGDGSDRSTVKLLKIARRPYRVLLDRVKDTLKPAP